MGTRRLDVGIDNVNEVYEGPGGALWELLMGEQIHVGGPEETDILAEKAGVSAASHVLDVCSALGGPARHLARRFGCRVTGLDGTWHMHQEAIRRTEDEALSDRVTYRFGNALDMPFRADSFDIVWGQDAWCYVTDKERLISECSRVLVPGGVLAFTDWMETGPMTDEEWTGLHEFMAFPYMETLEGYAALVRKAGLVATEREDLTPGFAAHIREYLEAVQTVHRAGIISAYGSDMYDAVVRGMSLWRQASAAGKVGRGRVIARKPG